MPPHRRKRSEDDDYDQLESSLHEAVHSLYCGIPVDRSAYDRAEEHRTNKRVLVAICREEEIRIQRYVLEQTIVRPLISFADELEKAIGTDRLQAHLEVAAARMATQIVREFRVIIADRNSEPDDRLKELMATYRLKEVEYFREYVEYRIEYPTSRVLGHLHELDQLRHELRAALSTRGIRFPGPDVLLCRIDYCVDASRMKDQQPTAWEAWMKAGT